jgi:hypothetical protein
MLLFPRAHRARKGVVSPLHKSNENQSTKKARGEGRDATDVVLSSVS